LQTITFSQFRFALPHARRDRWAQHVAYSLILHSCRRYFCGHGSRHCEPACPWLYLTRRRLLSYSCARPSIRRQTSQKPYIAW
jgi:hypothetical protein